MGYTMEASASLIGDAAVISNTNLHIGRAFSTGIQTTKYVAPSAVPAVHLVLK